MANAGRVGCDGDGGYCTRSFIMSCTIRGSRLFGLYPLVTQRVLDYQLVELPSGLPAVGGNQTTPMAVTWWGAAHTSCHVMRNEG